MARHRQPAEVARLKGSDRKDPQRYRTEAPKSELPLGNAPEHLSGGAQTAWFELSGYALPGVLTGADRFVMEVTASLLAEFRADPTAFTAGRYAQLVGCLARLGLTPADRQKLGTAGKAAANEFAEFAGG